MINYQKFFTSYIDQVKQEGRFREFRPFVRSAGEFPHALDVKTGKKIVMWCINDYLGMGQNPKVIQAAISMLQASGSGAGGTRNIGGNTNAISMLEEEIASLHNREKALVFTSGFVANETTLSTLAKLIPNLCFFSDSENHASIISGIRNSRAEKFVFNHNDMEHLESLLQSVDINRPKIIVFESIYSMDGQRSKIHEICDLAKKYNALTYIDEVHTIGLYGKGGAGYAQMCGIDHKIDIIQATLGKAIGVIGGYITGSEKLIEAIRLAAPGFIFTTSLPPSVAEAARVSINHLRNSDAERIAHQEVIAKTKAALKAAGIKFLDYNSHIIPIILGNPELTKLASEKLLNEHNIFVQHINFPTVARGTERLRFTPTPCHTDEMIENMVKALSQVLTEIGVVQAA